MTNTQKQIRGPATLLIALAALGVAGNLFPYPLFYGVDFLFGSIAVLIAVAIFGPVWGTAAAALPAAQTILLWNHPYAALVLLLEAFCVGLLLRRYRANLALAGFLFWLVVGIPLVFVLYRYALGMDHSDSLLACLKQGANGVINSLCASLLATYIPRLRAYQAGRDPRLSLFETVFNSFIAAALIPIFLLLTVDARRAVKEVEREASAYLAATSSRISLSVARWRDDHVRAMSMLADFLERAGPLASGELQQLLAAHRKAWPNFHGTFVTNAEGLTIAFDPVMNARGEPNIGINFSDRPYFQLAKGGGPSPAISEVFIARGGVFEPVFNVTTAVRPAGRFLGVVSGSVNLGDLGAILRTIANNVEYDATIVDENGHVVAATNAQHRPMSLYPNYEKFAVRFGQAYFFHRWPGQTMAPMARWKKSSLGMSTLIPGLGTWHIVVEVPLRSQQDQLYARYGQVLTIFLVLAFVLLVTSYWVASMITRPLMQLSAETTNLPERIQGGQSIEWPRSRLLEVSWLTENFNGALEALQRRFKELESSRGELAQANRTKDEFLSIASHELKTPLTPLKLQLQMLKTAISRSGEQAFDPARARRAFDIADQQINRLIRLIDDLLDVSRINAGKLRLNREPIDLAALLRNTGEQYGPQLAAAGCQLELRTPDSLTVPLDPLRIEQVVINLLTNAAKYAPGSRVELSLETRDGLALIRVRDEGPGIPEEARHRVFERFERVHSKDQVSGLGLGLFISRQIVEAHAGRLEVASESGKGSTFSIQLPLA